MSVRQLSLQCRFRWVFCQLDSLRRCRPGRILRALDELPGTLDATYERTLLDIDEQNWEYAHRLFQCITVASRPLRVEELAEFLAFDFDDEENPKFEAVWRDDDPEDAVLSTCSTLIAVVNIGDTAVVQFSHFSVKEFLTSNRVARGRVSRYYIPLEPAHLTIARACLTLLLSLDGSVDKATIKDLPLAFYAARYWVGHAKSGNLSLHARDAMQRVFDPNEPYFSAWAWLENYDDRRGLLPETPPTPRFPPLHRAARDDLDHITNWLITSRSRDPEELADHKTPLCDASGRGNLKVAQLLIEHGADVNAQCSADFRPLYLSPYYGRLDFSLLRFGIPVNFNAPVSGSLTALFVASERGHLEVIRVLLENGADPNVAWCGEVPLSRSLMLSHLDVARLLLEYGADINARNEFGSTLLHQAATRGDEMVVRLLLERGANIHAMDGKGKTPLQIASAPSGWDPRPERRKDLALLLQRSAEGSSVLLDRR